MRWSSFQYLLPKHFLAEVVIFLSPGCVVISIRVSFESYLALQQSLFCLSKMKRRIASKEKENAVTFDSQQQTDDEARNLQEVLLLRRVRARVQRSRRNISKLNDNLRLLRKCVITCLDIVDSAAVTIEQKRLDTKRLLQLVEQDDPASFSSRSHPVNPMIAGHTLKRAKISLKRLAANLTSESGSSNESGSDEDLQEEPPFISVSDSELLSAEEETQGIHSA